MSTKENASNLALDLKQFITELTLCSGNNAQPAGCYSVAVLIQGHFLFNVHNLINYAWEYQLLLFKLPVVAGSLKILNKVKISKISYKVHTIVVVERESREYSRVF